jgi:hypothetical protein
VNQPASNQPSSNQPASNPHSPDQSGAHLPSVSGHFAALGTHKEVQAVRIICDIVLKDDLLAHLKSLGATGWTWWMAHGKGEHSTEPGVFGELQRMYIEVWCTAAVAEKIFAYCNSSHFRSIGMSVGISPLFVSKETAAHLAKH